MELRLKNIPLLHPTLGILSAVVLSILFSCSKPENSVIRDFHLPAIFSDHMVIQQNADLPVWGEASPGGKIRIKTDWGEETEVTCDDSGKWESVLHAPGAGGPFVITLIAPDTSVVLKDVYTGEVWLASGQSNMEMPVMGWPPGAAIRQSDEEIRSATYPEIRMFTVQRAVSLEEENDVSGEWQVCSPETVKNFSATAYFFARRLQQELNVPIGIIHSSWGGTPAESWVSEESLKKLGDFDEQLKKLHPSDQKEKELKAWKDELNIVKVSPENLTEVDFQDSTAALPALDDTSWPAMNLPTLWEQTVLGDFDGVIWFRREFTMENEPAGSYSISLGPVDDMDMTFVNGKEIGRITEANQYQTERIYDIPSSILHKGKNTIAVRVIDPQGGGGIYGQPEQLYLQHDGQDRIDLTGTWKYLPVGEYRGGELYLMGVENSKFMDRPEGMITINAHTPDVLYNAMIAPIIRYPFKGVIWYQGENNVGRAEQYEKLFPALIHDWRERKDENFPFYFVQIAPYNYGDPTGDASAALRDAQRKALSVPSTGMVVTMDIGNPDNIHPANKQDVGGRLANLALADTYKKDVPYSGPEFESMDKIGGQLRITFEHADGLMAKGELTNVEIAGQDGVFHSAQATIVNDQLMVNSTEVKEPAAVRYAWKNSATATLFNKAGLPASSFMENTKKNEE